MRALLPLLFTLVLVVGALPALGATETPSPKELWNFNPEGQATFNDVSIDARGTILAAVQSDTDSPLAQDDEFFYWDLDSSKTNTPQLSHDPDEGLAGAPEGMGVVAVEPARNGDANLIAFGREGSSGDDANRNVYVHALGGVPPDNPVRYPSGTERPEGAVVDLWFLNDGDHLLAYHTDAIDLLQKRPDDTYLQRDRWTPPGDETLASVSVARDHERILVATTDGPIAQDGKIHLRTLERDGNDLDYTSNEWTQGRAAPVAAISADGQYAAVGVGNGDLFYFQFEDVPDGAEERTTHAINFSKPGFREMPGSITAIGLSPNGTLMAAGSDANQVRVYERTGVSQGRPLVRAASSSFDTGRAPSEILFTDNDRLFVVGGSLYGFHSRQFDPGTALEALWIVPGATSLDASDSGDTFIVSTGTTVRAFEQAYRAMLSVDGPDEVDPGQPFTLDVHVANTGSAFDSYSVTTRNLPGAWSMETNPDTVSLLPGQNGTFQLNLTPDGAHPPGETTFTVQATSLLDPSGGEAGSTEVTVDVNEVRGADVTLESTSVDVSRGASTLLNARVTNIGNVDGPIEIEIEQEEDWPVTIGDQAGDERTIELDAQESRNLNIAFDVPADATEGSTNSVTITARPGSGGAEGSADVDLIVDPAYGGSITGPTSAQEARPDSQVSFTVTIENTGNTRDDFSVTASSNASNPDHFYETSVSPATFTLDGGSTKDVTVTVNVPRAAQPGDTADVEISTRSEGVGGQTDTATFTVRITEETDDSPLPLLAPLALALTALRRRRQRG